MDRNYAVKKTTKGLLEVRTIVMDSALFRPSAKNSGLKSMETVKSGAVKQRLFEQVLEGKCEFWVTRKISPRLWTSFAAQMEEDLDMISEGKKNGKTSLNTTTKTFIQL